MEQTLTINLGGIVFHIEDIAFEKLKNYLDSIKMQFINEDEKKEIIDDIEARIAELFEERLNNKKQVITTSDINEIIKIMGNPHEFEGESNTTNGYTKNKTNRRMYRDPDSRILGGVCGGMGAYWNFDPVILRIIFVFLALISVGAGVIVYLILWIVIPEAKTTAQKLEMKGEPVNVSNIGKSVKDEFHNVKKNMNL